MNKIPSPTSIRPGPIGPAIRSLIGACAGMFLSPSSMLLISFGLYLGPIVADTGWSRTVLAGAIGPTMVLAGLMSPVVGWAAGRLGPRRFLTFAFPAFGLAMALLGTATSAGMFAMLLALAGVLVSGQSMLPHAYTVSGWFEARRGMALGVMNAFTGVGLAVVPPVAAHLVEVLGWRTTFFTLGAFVAVVGVLIARLLIVDPPVAAVSNRAEVAGVPWKKALTMPVFWWLTVSISLIGCVAAGGMVNLFELLTSRGVAGRSATFIMSVVGISLICSRLVFGYLFDRFSAHRIMVLICLLLGAAFVVIATTDGPAGVVIAAILIGVGFGAEGDALSYMTSRIFGMRDFAKIFGIEFMAFTFGGGAGPVLFAIVKGRSGDYQMALWAAVGLSAVAAVLASLITRRHLLYARRDTPARTANRVDALVPHQPGRPGLASPGNP